MGDSRNDGLQIGRAIAAISVAYFHSYIALRAFPEAAQHPIGFLRDFGYLGVNLFFAISGYVICIVASRPGFSPQSFAIKRIFRLYPMYWVTMLLVLLLIICGKYRDESVGHFLYSMTLLPQPTSAAFDPSWTLERELVFYALTAVIVPFGGIPTLAAVLTALALAGWWLGNPWSFHLVSTVQADFLAGVIVFLVHEPMRRLGSLVPLLFGIALLTYTRFHDFTFSAPLSFGIILLGLVNLKMPSRWWAARVLIALGDASYSIYLLHFIIFVLSVNLAVQRDLALGLPVPEWMCEPWRLLTLAACCGISHLTFRWIEQPMIVLGGRIAARYGLKTTMPSLGQTSAVRLAPPD